MEKDISNNTLATLLVVSIVVSIAGTWFMLSSPYGPTGWSHNLAIGTARVEVEGTASLTIIDSLIDFANGSVTADSAWCEMTSGYNGSTGIRGNCTWAVISDQFVIENTGNVNISVDVASDLNATDWLGKSGAKTYFAAAYNTTSVPSCFGGDVAVGGNLTVSWSELNTSDEIVCRNMFYGTADSALQVDLNITIPTGTSPGVKNVTVTFTGTSI